MILFFDTETTGKLDSKQPAESKVQPDLVQLAAMMLTDGGVVAGSVNCIIEPAGWDISPEVAEIHGINPEYARRCGVPIKSALSMFSQFCKLSKKLVAYNLDFDDMVMQVAYHRIGVPHRMSGLEHICAMKASTPVVKKPAKWKGGGYGWPKLSETYAHLFNGETFDGAHNAMNDVVAMIRVYWELKRLGAI